METGIAAFATHDAIDPASLGRLVEDRGHAALSFAEHTHIPAILASTLPSCDRGFSPVA